MINQVIMCIVERLHIRSLNFAAKISKIIQFCNVEMAKSGCRYVKFFGVCVLTSMNGFNISEAGHRNSNLEVEIPFPSFQIMKFVNLKISI